MFTKFSLAYAVATVMEQTGVTRSFFTSKEFETLCSKLDGQRNFKDAVTYIESLRQQKARDENFSIICIIIGQFITKLDMDYTEGYELAVKIEDAWYSPMSTEYDYVSDFAIGYLQNVLGVV